MREIAATFDPSLSARVLERRPLRYTAGADPAVDRPAHVRAGSSLVWVGSRLAVVQDDALFLALVAPRHDLVGAVALPAPGGVRQFDDARGNQREKLDLEAAFVHAGRLIALGSGATAERCRVVVVDLERGGRTRVVDARALYDRLRADAWFCATELNVEGAVIVGEALRVFQRGNGAALGGRAASDATADLPLAEVLAFLDAGGAGPAPAPRDVVRYRLGALAGVSLGFTDAAAQGERVLYVAAAEDSPNAVEDGPVAGMVLGALDEDRARHAVVLDGERPLAVKAEGIAIDPDRPDRAFLVTDPDDPSAPSELVVVELQGF
ncbi:MAG: hypothetical protein IT376_08070 [Polyangiaceae bacterium]|nr:hypothetical protein [Polyangiaceae bacterium]